jgi:glycosyltransferase involved in cell wall biosynthesis
MTQPLVSIIIPTYNSARFIRDAVDSALAQTYPHCEIVVVDDGSTDGTQALLAEHYGERIRTLYQENRGASAARNTGIGAARGTLIQFCDADDQLWPEKVARGVAVFAQQPAITLLYTLCDHVEADGRTRIVTPHPPLPSGDVFCDLLNGPLGNFVVTSSVMARRDALLKAGCFNENLPVAEDWDLWLRLTASAPAAGLNELLVYYRQQPGGLHTDPVAMAEGRLKVIQLARDYPARRRCLDDAAYDRLEAARYHRLALANWRHGRRADARQAFRAAVRLDPRHATVRRLYVLLTYGLSARVASAFVARAARLKARLRGWLHAGS